MISVFLTIVTVSPIWGQGVSERQWATADGRFQVKAVFIETKGEQVVLKRSDNGKTIEVPLPRLSEDDRKFLASLDTSQIAWQPSEKELAAAPKEFHDALEKFRAVSEKSVRERGKHVAIVAGQVFEKGDKPMKKGTYTVTHLPYGKNGSDAHCCEDGWFAAISQYNFPHDTIQVATFHHDKVEVRTDPSQELGFYRIGLERTPEQKLAALDGIVQDEKGQPVANAKVTLNIYMSIAHRPPRLSINTSSDRKGQYSFSGVPSNRYELIISSPQGNARCCVQPDNMKNWEIVTDNYLLKTSSDKGKNFQVDKGKITATLSAPGK